MNDNDDTMTLWRSNDVDYFIKSVFRAFIDGAYTNVFDCKLRCVRYAAIQTISK